MQLKLLNLIYPVRTWLLHVHVILASAELSFRKLKLIKTYLLSTMSRESLTNSAILLIESQITKTIDFQDIIEYYASIKLKKSIILNQVSIVFYIYLLPNLVVYIYVPISFFSFLITITKPYV